MTLQNSICEKLSKINPLFDVGLTTYFQSSDISTQMGLLVPKGYLLSYQLATTEGDFCAIEYILISASGLKTQLCTIRFQLIFIITEIERANEILTEIIRAGAVFIKHLKLSFPLDFCFFLKFCHIFP